MAAVPALPGRSVVPALIVDSSPEPGRIAGPSRRWSGRASRRADETGKHAAHEEPR